MFSISFLVQEKFDMLNSNLSNFKEHILREISALHVKFDKLIDVLIKNQTTNMFEKSQHDISQSEIFEKDIIQMKPLATESDINNLEINLCNQEFELAFVSSSIYYQYFVIFIFIFIYQI